MCLRYIVLLSTLFLFCEGGPHLPSPHTDKELSLNRCAIKILNSFDVSHLTLISYPFLRSKNINSSLTTWGSTLTSHIHKQNRWAITTNYVEKRDNYFSKTYVPPNGFIILMKTCHELRLILEKLTTKNRGKKLVAIFQSPLLLKKPAKVLSKIIKPFLSKDGMYVNVMIPDPNNATRYVIHFQTRLCGKPKRNNIFYCSFGIFTNKPRTKKSLLQGCLIKAVASHRVPFSNVNINKNIKGIETMMLDTIAFYSKLTISYVPSKERGVLYKNGTSTGGFALLQNGTADILFGAYTMTELKEKYFRSTVNYIDTRISWCAPLKPNINYYRIFNRIIDIFFPIAAGTLCLCLSFVTWYLYKFENGEWPSYGNFLNSFQYNFSVLVGVTIRTLPRTDRIRILMGSFITTGLVLNTFFSSYLTSMMISTTYDIKYDDIDSVYEENLTTYSSIPLIDYLKNVKPTVSSKITIDNILGRLIACDSETRCLEEVAKNNSVVFLPLLESSYLFKQKEIPNSSLIYCPQKYFHKALIAMYTKREFLFMEELNKIIGDITSSGLIIKWANDVTSNLRSMIYPEHGVIRLRHLIPIFKAYLCVNGIAILIFVAEVILGKLRKI